MEDRDVNFFHSSVVKINLVLMTAKMSPWGEQNHSVAREIAERSHGDSPKLGHICIMH